MTGAIAAMQTERQFSDAIVEYARLCGWLIHRDPVWRATAAEPGYPDLTMTNGRRIVFAELKGKGKATAAQQAWLRTLEAVALKVPDDLVRVYLWTPENWGDIELVLR